MSVDVLAAVYEHINRGGRSRFYGVSAEARYQRADGVDLDGYGMRNVISSTELFTSSSSDNNLYLFSGDSFDGEFRHLAHARTGGSRLDNLTDLGFNDRAASLVQVATGRRPEFRISFRDAFLDEWNTSIDGQLGSDANRTGDPGMRWQAFPRGISYLDPDLVYLKIHQDLNINIDWWPDYSAWIEYHIRLYLDGANHVQGYCARWAYWVEGGLKSSGIADRLQPKVIAGCSTLDDRLAARLGALNFAVHDLYILPGNQRFVVDEGTESGSVDDDATIVVELS